MSKSILRNAAWLVIAGVFLTGNNCRADEVAMREELSRLKDRVQALEDKLGEQDRCIKGQEQCIFEQNKKIAEYESKFIQFDRDLHRQTGAPISIAEGLEIGAGGTIIVQGTSNTNNASPEASKKASRADASYSADIALGKEFKEIGGKVFLHLEAGQGAGLEDDLTLYSNVNRDADNDNNARLTELWYEQALCQDKVALTLGKLDPTAYFDNNEVANDETSQFLSRIFRNSPAVEFPDNTAGMRLAYIPLAWFELGYGVFDGNSDWEKVGDNLFNIVQAAFKTNVLNLAGTYRFFGWRNNSYHTKWSDAAKTKEVNCGFGLSFDQKVTDIVNLFARYAWQDPKVYNPDFMATGDLNYSLAHSWSAGLQVEGKPWGRQKDVLAFAAGQAIPSGDYKKYGSPQIASPEAKPEGHLEAYYKIFVNDHLSISPDFQYVWNPFGKDVADDQNGIFVAGMRTQMDF